MNSARASGLVGPLQLAVCPQMVPWAVVTGDFATNGDELARPTIHKGPAGLEVCDLLLCNAPDIERGVRQNVHQILLTPQKRVQGLRSARRVLGQFCAIAGHCTRSPDTRTTQQAGGGRLGVAVQD